MARAALGVAVVALLVAGAAWLRPAAAPCRCDEAAALAARVAALEAERAGRVAVMPSVPSVPSDVPSVPSGVPSVPSAPAAAGDAVVEVRAPHPAVAVMAGPGDALAVTNRDPALTGQVMTVELRTASGAVVERRVTVPAPAR